MNYWNVMFDIAQGLYDMRKDAGLSQRDVAGRMRIRHPGVVRLEHAGYDGYTVKSIARYAQACGYRVKITFEEMK